MTVGVTNYLLEDAPVTRTNSTFLALVAVLLSPMAANATQITIDFEGQTPFDAIGSTYASQGVTFGPSCYFYPEDSNYPASSGVSSAYCYPLPEQIDFSSAVSNVGAYFNAYDHDIIFSAFGAGGLIGRITISETTPPIPGGPQYDGPLYYELPYSGIEYVTLSTFGSGEYYNFDDLTFTSSVPEPGTLALFGIGLLGMGLSRRRKV